MHSKSLTILEYPKILKRLAEHTTFSVAAELANQLRPTPHYTEALERQAETSEARRLLSEQPDTGVGGVRDVRPLLEQARRAIPIPPQGFLTLERTLTAARDLRRKLTRLEDRYPRLADIAYRLEENSGLIHRIHQTLDDSGRVKDAASSELARIRREAEIAHSRLQEKMRRLVASEKFSPYLQESIITQRDGRYVVPLKAEFKGRIRGIIHDQSASGATLFVEPAGVVELNNRWRQLQLEEEQEIRRILQALTAQVAERSKFIAATVQALAELDLLFAKARYAEAIRAVPPILADPAAPAPDAPRITLRRARHPLLDPETVVPIDLTLSPDTRLLIITGPNTGGKTVSLKTAGLLALMAQSGMHIPAADGSALLVFDGIFADIGDEQSLEQSLSTFSAHMTNIVAILRRATPRSLVILDELGAGTDPIEGAALARAILEHLLSHNITTLVATHYAELKAFAYLTDGVENASTEFDLETLSPTYELRVGLPGASNAFAVAERLGLHADILRKARELVGEDRQETEKLLARIQAELEAARMERLRLEEERAEAEYYRQKIEERLAKIEEEERQILKRARQKARREIDKTRAELRRLRRKVRRAVAPVADATAAPPNLTAKTLEAAEARLDEMEAAIEARETPPPAPARAPRRPLKVGDRVEIPHLGSRGVVTAIGKNDVEVQLGHFRTTLKPRDVALLAPPAAEAEAEAVPAPPVAARPPADGLAASPGMELDLRGQTAEDALLKLDAYLDQAYLAGLPFVRLIHGRGTGVLRQAVREALETHPLVVSHRPGREGEGGDGVTIAKLTSE